MDDYDTTGGTQRDDTARDPDLPRTDDPIRDAQQQDDSTKATAGVHLPGGTKLEGSTDGDQWSGTLTIPFGRAQLRACPMVCRRPDGRPSAGFRSVQSHAPRSGLVSDYATIVGAAPSLNDASTAREDEAASTLTLLPKQRGREQAGGCQLLRFAA